MPHKQSIPKADWTKLPAGEKQALQSLCDLMTQAVGHGVVSALLPRHDAPKQEWIECFAVAPNGCGVDHDLSMRALELGLVATALLQFKTGALRACQLPPSSPPPTAQQVQVLSWKESFNKDAYGRIGEVEHTLRVLAGDLCVHNRPSGQRSSRRRRVVQLLDQTLERLSSDTASLATRIKCHLQGSEREDEDLGGDSEEEEDAAACQQDPEARAQDSDRGFAVHSALERVLQKRGRRRRVLQLCKNLAVMRDRLVDEAVNLPDLSIEERGMRTDLHRCLGDAVAANGTESLRAALRAVQEKASSIPAWATQLKALAQHA